MSKKLVIGLLVWIFAGAGVASGIVIKDAAVLPGLTHELIIENIALLIAPFLYFSWLILVGVSLLIILPVGLIRRIRHGKDDFLYYRIISGGITGVLGGTISFFLDLAIYYQLWPQGTGFFVRYPLIIEIAILVLVLGIHALLILSVIVAFRQGMKVKKTHQYIIWAWILLAIIAVIMLTVNYVSNSNHPIFDDNFPM